MSGYMLSCWEALADRGHEIHVLAPQTSSESNTDFRVKPGNGVVTRVVAPEFTRNARYVGEFLEMTNADVIIVSGWWNRAYRSVAMKSSRPFIMVSDNPYRGTVQALGLRYRHARFLSKANAIGVPGERGLQLISRSGVSPDKVFQPMYGISDECAETEWMSGRNGFLFTGQLIERKGVRDLLAAYRSYREASQDPMPLVVAGLGPLEGLVKRESGIQYLGFVQPRELLEVRNKMAFLILPSHEDAWPLALVEAAYAGMGILCSIQCGSSVELVRDGWNGAKFLSGNVRDIVKAMQWAEIQIAAGAPISQRSRELAKPFTSSQWAKNWENALLNAIASVC